MVLKKYPKIPLDSANMPLPLNFPIVQWGECFTMIFIAILTRWRLYRNSPNVISLHEGTHVRRFSKTFLKMRLFSSVMKHISIRLDASTNKTCATGLTPIHQNCIKGLWHSVVWNFFHWEETLEIANMANIRNRFIHCMDNAVRHLLDMIFKTA